MLFWTVRASEPSPRAGPGPALAGEQPFRNEGPSAELFAMQWIEALINISALAGFIGVANAWPVDDRTRR